MADNKNSSGQGSRKGAGQKGTGQRGSDNFNKGGCSRPGDRVQGNTQTTSSTGPRGPRHEKT